MAEDAQPGQTTIEPPTVTETWTHGYTEASGVRFHYVTQGEGR